MRIVQRSDAWYAARRGKPTGSGAWRIMSTKRNGEPSAARESYMIELLAERLTGQLTNHFETEPMREGMRQEPEAIQAYEFVTGEMVEPGYWIDKLTWGCTPDGFVGDDGILSVKCPLPKNIIRQRYFEDAVEPEYYWQMVAEMAATDRAWCDLAIYSDQFSDPEHRIWIRRIDRDENAVALFVEKLNEFLRELESKTEEIRKDYSDDFDSAFREQWL